MLGNLRILGYSGMKRLDVLYGKKRRQQWLGRTQATFGTDALPLVHTHLLCVMLSTLSKETVTTQCTTQLAVQIWIIFLISLRNITKPSVQVICQGFKSVTVARNRILSYKLPNSLCLYLFCSLK